MIEIERFTDIGVYRDRNEDNFISLRCTLDGKPVTIASVCDGMGGLDAGDYASKELCSSLKRGIVNKDFESIHEVKRAITIAIKEANKIIYKNKTKFGTKCGTTVSCVMLADKGYFWHVGDSRIISVKNGDVVKLTNDHTVVQQLVNTGKITEKEALTHPKQNVLTKAIGVFESISIDMQEFDYENSSVVLVTDGFWHGLTNNDYLKLASKEVTFQSLFEKVVSKGETDNVTGLLLRSS